MLTDANGEIDKRLDEIHDRIDILMREGSVAEIDRVGMVVCHTCRDIDVVLGYLISTLPVKNDLKNRRFVFNHAVHLCREIGEDPDSLLKGLE